jgi:endonuclease IV
MPRLAQETLNIYLANMRILKALSVQYKFKLLCFWQPNIYVKKDLRDFEEIIYNLNSNEREFTQIVYSLFKKDNKLRKIPFFYNLQDVVNNADKAIYLDFCHMNSFGNEIVAKAVFKDFIKQLKLKRSK